MASMNTQTNTVNSVNAKRPSSAKKGLSFTAEQLKQLHWREGLSLTQIGALYGVSCAAIEYWIKKLGLAGRSRVDNLLFEPSPALSYVLGVVLGDGCVYRLAKGNYSIRLSVCDKVFAERFSESVSLLGFKPCKMIRTQSKHEGWRDRWLSYFYSDAFGNWYAAMTLDKRIELGMKHPDAFVRGFYEAEGTIVRHHGRLEITMSDTHADGLIIDAIQASLPSGIVSNKYMVEKCGIKAYCLSITRALDVKRFLAWTMPCMKTVPRPEILPAEQEETQANTEPIPDRNAGAGVENTKVAQNGRQVGHRPATDDAQPSGRHQPIRCIPTYAETHRAQQKCPAPGRAITFL